MSPRTPTLPPTDRAMWRLLISRAHPEAGGDHEHFIWAGAVRDVVCSGRQDQGSSPPGPDENPRIPYPDGADFQAGTVEALRMAEELGMAHVYGVLLALLEQCSKGASYAHRESRGASYRQLAAVGHAVGMSKEARTGWYRVAESVPLSDHDPAPATHPPDNGGILRLEIDTLRRALK